MFDAMIFLSSSNSLLLSSAERIITHNCEQSKSKSPLFTAYSTVSLHSLPNKKARNAGFCLIFLALLFENKLLLHDIIDDVHAELGDRNCDPERNADDLVKEPKKHEILDCERYCRETVVFAERREKLVLRTESEILVEKEVRK